VTVEDLIDEMIRQVGKGGDLEDADLREVMLDGVKSALRRLPLHASDRCIRDKTSGSLTSGAQTMAVPSGSLQILGIWILNGSERIEVFKQGLEDFNRLYRSSGAAMPSYFHVRGSVIEFNVPADQTYSVIVERTIEIDNVTEETSLTFDSSVFEIVKDGAKSIYYFEYEEDTEKGVGKNNQFEAGLRKIEARDFRLTYPDYVEEA